MATKFKGKNLSLMIDGDEVNDDIRSVVIDNEEADDDGQTFFEFTQGGSRTWTMVVEADSHYGDESLWRWIWDNVGTDATFILKPYGNAAPSTSQPHFTGTLTVGAEPAVGGTAGEAFTFEYTFTLAAKPTLVSV